MIPDGFVFLGCAISSFQTRDANSVFWDHGVTVYCAGGVAFTQGLVWNGTNQDEALQKLLNYSNGYALDIPLVLYNVYVEQSQLLDIFWAAQQSFQAPCNVYLSVLCRGTLGDFASSKKI